MCGIYVSIPGKIIFVIRFAQRDVINDKIDAITAGIKILLVTDVILIVSVPEMSIITQNFIKFA